MFGLAAEWEAVSEQVVQWKPTNTNGVTWSRSLGLPYQVPPAILLASSSSMRRAASFSPFYHRWATPTKKNLPFSPLRMEPIFGGHGGSQMKSLAKQRGAARQGAAWRSGYDKAVKRFHEGNSSQIIARS